MATWPAIDAFHVRYATRLASALGARVVMPDYPLAPEHTWRDSHDALVEQAGALGRPSPAGSCWPATPPAAAWRWRSPLVDARPRDSPPATHLVLHAPWVDLTTQHPGDRRRSTRVDPWLFYSAS